MTSDPHRLLTALLEDSSLAVSSNRTTLSPVHGGANSRAYRVETGNERLFLKVYFRGPRNSRDRLTAEYSFLTVTTVHGISCVPRPLAWSPTLGAALYEYVEGEPLFGLPVTAKDVAEAARFLETLNELRTLDAARALPNGSEACFSLERHGAAIAARLARLEETPIRDDLDQEMHRFLRKELIPRWQSEWDHVRQEAAVRGYGLSDSLPETARCLSPSDFGFHNALRRRDGSLCFVDFEHAGWDDPAKLIADFFCQPAVPVPESFYGDFVKRVAAITGLDTDLAWRTNLLRLSYRIKWCCIMLNEFVPADQERRAFADCDEGADLVERKSRQLAKARSFLHRSESGHCEAR